ncbi:MAG: U32 family peptidase [Pirellulaceae bacterium]
MVPHSVLGEMRRTLIEQLDAARTTSPLPCAQAPVAARMVSQAVMSPQVSDSTMPPTLRVLCRTLAQLDTALEAGVSNVITDFHDIREYRLAIDRARTAGANIELATLRIHKPGEDGLFSALEKRQADGWLVRNLAAMQYCQQHGIPFACDFSLNVTNPLTAEQLWNWGATRVTAAYDLNRDQLIELVRGLGWGDRIEVVVHQHMPMFHMEHCVFCSVLSLEKTRQIAVGPVIAMTSSWLIESVRHMCCTPTLVAAIRCTMPRHRVEPKQFPPLIELGVRQFRIELLRDAPTEETKSIIGLYQQLVLGQLDGTSVWQQLKAHNRIGVTRGTLEQPRNPLAIL